MNCSRIAQELLKACPPAFFRCHFGLLMERAVLDWQELTLDGFTDGTHVQLTVADWLRLGGGVERKVEEPAPRQPDTRHTSDYSYYTDTEEEEEVEVDSPTPVTRASPPRQLRSRAPPYPPQCRTGGRRISDQRTSPARLSRSRSPLPRRGQDKQQDREQTPLLAAPSHRRRRRAGHRAGRKVQERRARAAQARVDTPNESESHHRTRSTASLREGVGATPQKGKGKGKASHRPGKGKGKGTSKTDSGRTRSQHFTARASESVPLATSPFAATVAQVVSPFASGSAAPRTTTRVPLSSPVPANLRLPPWDWTARR